MHFCSCCQQPPLIYSAWSTTAACPKAEGEHEQGGATAEIKLTDFKCYACGQTGHLAKDNACPAKGAECEFCHKVSHWKRVCFTLEQSKQLTNMHMATYRHKCSRNTKRIDSTLHAVSAQQPANLPFETMIQIQYTKGHSLKGDIDTGSYCSIVQ